MNSKDIDTEATVIGIPYMRGFSTNISNFIDVWGDYFHTFSYVPVFPLATCIQPNQEKITNAVWESYVRWFIRHSKVYNEEGVF